MDPRITLWCPRLFPDIQEIEPCKYHERDARHANYREEWLGIGGEEPGCGEGLHDPGHPEEIMEDHGGIEVPRNEVDQAGDESDNRPIGLAKRKIISLFYS